MDSFGEIKRNITLADTSATKIYPSVSKHVYYEAAIIVQSDGVEMLYVRATDTRFGKDRYGRHFNAMWMDEKQQDWFAHMLGGLLCDTIALAGERARRVVRTRMRDLLTAMGISDLPK